MGTTLFDCRVEKNFTQLEVSEEITKNNENEHKLKDKKNFKHKRDIRSKKIKRNKELNNITNTTNNEEDDVIIINTDEEKDFNDKENTNKNKNNNTSEKKNKKINNTIFINNSNVTISQLKEKKLKEELNSIKPNSNYFNTNEDNIELDEILNDVFNNNRASNINFNNKNFLTQSDIDYNYNKEYFDQLYSEQSHIKLELKNLNENDEKIIKKLNKLKEKINNKNKPKQKAKYHKYKFEFNPAKVQRTISLTNKQIKKNIPNYRKAQGFFNSICFNKNSYLNKFKGNKNINAGMHCNTMGNSFNKSLYSSLMIDSVKEHWYNSTNSNNLSNNIIEGNTNGHTRGTPSIYSVHKSYFNNSSINQTESNGFNSQAKSKKRKSLYNVIGHKNKSKQKLSSNKAKKFKNNLMKIDIKKEIENNIDENENNLLYHHYRDIIEIILPKNFHKDSVVDTKIYIESKTNKNKAILNYNKLNLFNTSIILYDGILYKVNDKKNNGFKLSKRYFQILKNCFRYYNSFNKDKDKDKNEEKPLVQFDIRHIKDLQIIENDFLSEYKIENKDIEMVFCIYLNQNDDFFVFAVNNENLGKSVFDILNLLKNYYEDKK